MCAGSSSSVGLIAGVVVGVVVALVIVAVVVWVMSKRSKAALEKKVDQWNEQTIEPVELSVAGGGKMASARNPKQSSSNKAKDDDDDDDTADMSMQDHASNMQDGGAKPQPMDAIGEHEEDPESMVDPSSMVDYASNLQT